MQRDNVLKILKSAEQAPRARGVVRAALFGSLARGEAGPESDIDSLADLDPEVVGPIDENAGVKSYIAEMFGGPVDVVDLEGPKPDVRSSATADAIYAV